MERFTSERALAEVAIGWLEGQHWDVYQEVATGPYSGRADIVAVQGALTWIVEVKTSLSLDVMAQAVEWYGWASFVSVAVPMARQSRSRTFAERVLHDHGIGVIECDVVGLVRSLTPRLCRRTPRPIRQYLDAAQKTMAPAGSAGGGYHTPFAATCRGVNDYVHLHPGCTMREVVEALEHHYLCDATARSCLRQWIGTKKIPGVEERRDGRKIRLFPVKKRRAT